MQAMKSQTNTKGQARILKTLEPICGNLRHPMTALAAVDQHSLYLQKLGVVQQHASIPAHSFSGKSITVSVWESRQQMLSAHHLQVVALRQGASHCLHSVRRC